MPTMSRKQEREETFLMLFELEFHGNARTVEEIYQSAQAAREVGESEYITTVLSGVQACRETIDGYIARHSKGWNRERITTVASAVMMLAVYEMLYMKDIPLYVSVNEALELIKKYDEDKARVFVNGVLNAVSKDPDVLSAREQA